LDAGEEERAGMDDNQLRTFGLAGGGAAMVAALALTLIGDEKNDTAQPTIEPPQVSATVTTPAPSAAASAPIPSAPVVETAMADGPAPPIAVVKPAPSKASDTPQNPNLEFIVRFDDRHPMSRAQDLWLQGKRLEAEALARATLTRRAELRGLCFSRFTLGAEIVLAHCARVPRTQLERTSMRWLRKLRAMPGVQYCDANVVVDVENR
jgi:hypothetical protein